jgi:hypothetical protein
MVFEYPTSVGVVRLARARIRWMVRFAGKGRRRRPSRRDPKGYNLHGGSAFTIRAEGYHLTKLSLAGAVRRAGVDRGVCQCLDDGPSAQVPRPLR